MLRDVLMYLFMKSESRIDMLIVTVATVLFINSKYKKGLALLLGGGLVTALIEVLLGI